MEHKILYKPSFAMVEFRLDAGESIVVESGSMAGMSPNMEIKTSIGGTGQGFLAKIFAFFAALVRKFLGGESIFMNTYTPSSGGGVLYVAPALTGDIIHQRLEGGKSLYIQATSYLASTPGIRLKTVWMGLRSFFSGEGMFLLRAEGEGEIWINSYGAIKAIDVDGEYIVDTGHMVAFEDSLEYQVKAVGGLKSTLFSGEGLVMKFSGKGRLYIQTHNVDSLVGWVTPMLP